MELGRENAYRAGDHIVTGHEREDGPIECVPLYYEISERTGGHGFPVRSI
jgi:hypothetical protein